MAGSSEHLHIHCTVYVWRREERKQRWRAGEEWRSGGRVRGEGGKMKVVQGRRGRKVLDLHSTN